MEPNGIISDSLKRIEGKLDEVRDRISEMEVMNRETVVKQSILEARVEQQQTKIELLQSAHDKAIGFLKVLSAPGILSMIYTLFKIFEKNN